jgi:hypothetical protein
MVSMGFAPKWFHNFIQRPTAAIGPFSIRPPIWMCGAMPLGGALPLNVIKDFESTPIDVHKPVISRKEF